MKKLLFSLMLLSSLAYAKDKDDNNTTGPQGPAGPQGAQGPMGATGLSGANALSSVITPVIELGVEIFESSRTNVAIFNSFQFNQDLMGVRVLFRPFHKAKK